MTRLLLYFWDYLIMLPAAILCMLPVLDNCRIRKRVLFTVMTAAIIVISFALAVWRYAFDLPANIPLAVSLIPSAIFYFVVIDARIIKLWYILISVSAVFSFGGLSTYFADAMLGREDTVISFAIKWLICMLFFAAALIFRKKLTWFFSNRYMDPIWKFVWIVPAIIISGNIIMIPIDYRNVHVGRIFFLYILSEIMMIAFYVIFMVMQYAIARAIANKTEAEQNAHILSLQAAQYENLKKYMESTSRIRHDFIFMAKTAQKLAANGENEQLKKLLAEYTEGIDENVTPVKYCEHSALNAITDYYAEKAGKAGLEFSARLNVPQNILISDYELCSIAGNILDNAVAAAEEAAEKAPRIRFVADTRSNGDLYIAVSNPYGGRIKKKNDSFISTKKGGHGIGLESVKAIVRKNKGYCNFRYDDKSFYSEIMLRQG